MKNRKKVLITGSSIGHFANVLRHKVAGALIRDYLADFSGEARWDALAAFEGMPEQDVVIIFDSEEKLVRYFRDIWPNSLIICVLGAEETSKRVRVLDAGADRVSIPSVDVLAAYIEISGRYVSGDQPEKFNMGGVTLDAGTRQLTLGGKTHNLTGKEYELLELFMRHPRQVLTRQLIFERVWKEEYQDSNVIEVYVSYIRQKLETRASMLQTTWGVGYMFNPDFVA